ncbi:Uncharacterized protein TCAP_01245 [Tolypocladium capitatum]|uniref:Myb-like domain-containing protein n=1 Tax=Tolypocladium capitatum TaxID=45235 RepID=A0A2K3QMT5_9HYPO|nr:Uncharacterized protein TCAP_01245 [Tolypocladium capitatum]
MRATWLVQPSATPAISAHASFHSSQCLFISFIELHVSRRPFSSASEALPAISTSSRARNKGCPSLRWFPRAGSGAHGPRFKPPSPQPRLSYQFPLPILPVVRAPKLTLPIVDQHRGLPTTYETRPPPLRLTHVAVVTHSRLNMAMNNKNWNDRADKDLFFTILSVKNIGVISGAEWTTIGNHMRAMGYGFTNEGCRQHFQGLRRAQNKADANGAAAESAKRVDPTLNPITRRPGPGRGRPRKQQDQDSTGQPSPGAGAVPAHALGQVPGAVTGPFPGAVPGQFFGTMPGQAHGALLLGAPGQPQQSQSPHQSPGAPTDGDVVSSEHASAAPGDPSAPAITASAVQPEPVSTDPDHVIEGDVDADGAESAGQLESSEQAEQDEDDHHHPAKRQKMDSHELEPEPEPEHDPSLDDEAVLALAAHNGSGGADQYSSDFDNYGEA